MTQQDRAPFAQALGIMAETLGQPLSALRVEGYFSALRDLDLPIVTYAIERALREETYNVLPTPGKLRTLAVGTPADEAEAGWLALLETVRRVGYYGAPMLPPGLQRAVEAVWGGWQSLCRELPSQDDRMFEGHRTRFLAAYRVLQARPALLAPEPVRGVLEP